MRSARWFVAVGTASALTHALVFEWLQDRTTLAPEACNALGFAAAFALGFEGHRRLSFPGGRGVAQSLWRHALTAGAGLATNELLFTALHRTLEWPASGALVAGMVAAAAQTWWLSRHWTFAMRSLGSVP